MRVVFFFQLLVQPFHVPAAFGRRHGVYEDRIVAFAMVEEKEDLFKEIFQDLAISLGEKTRR